MTPEQMTELAARLKRLSSDYAFMNAYPGAAAAMVNAADLIDSMARRVPLSDEQVFELADPFGSFQYGDAQGHKRIAFARAIEAAHGIRSENSSATLTGCDDAIKRLREAIAEHPLSPIHGYAADITAMLARLDAAERENERLRAENEKLSGEHSMMRALLLSAQESSREDYADARRYRWLRRKFAIIATSRDGTAFVPINLPRPTYIAPDAAVELDAAIDAAMAAQPSDERREG